MARWNCVLLMLMVLGGPATAQDKQCNPVPLLIGLNKEIASQMESVEEEYKRCAKEAHSSECFDHWTKSIDFLSKIERSEGQLIMQRCPLPKEAIRESRKD